MCWKGKKQKKRTTTAEIQAEIVNYAACTHLHILLSDLEGCIFGIQDWTKIFWGFTKMLASHTLGVCHKFLPEEHLLIQAVKFLSLCS